ncbi:MAG: hypothetical protein R3258_09995 [Acidimicrobiia bacterium]|nr:hypothetical protein [Acidimicrobiia bacterium]
MGSQQPLEMILVRQLSKHLAIPVWILEATGELAFYNEPAEVVLGVEFADLGPLVSVDISEMFEITEVDGEPVPEDELPIMVALTTNRPSSRKVRFRAKDGIWKLVEVIAMPIVGQGDRCLGVMATFWELDE